MRILIREGARPRVYRFLFKAVVQLVLLFVAETWVINIRMGRVLRSLHDQVARQLAGQLKWRRSDGRWIYTLKEAAR